MKKKLFILVISNLVIGLLLFSVLFITVFNSYFVRDDKERLQQFNAVAINILKTNNEDNLKVINDNFNGYYMKLYVLKDDSVVIKSENNEEIKNALKVNDNEFYLKINGDNNKNILYYKDSYLNYKVVTYMEVQKFNIFEFNYLKYYLIIYLVVLLIGIIFTLRFLKVINKPIKELITITDRVAHGDFTVKFMNDSKDEIGELGQNFNEMSEKLDITLRKLTEQNNKLESILKSMDSGVIAVDKNHNIIIINDYAKKILGIRNNIIGENFNRRIKYKEFEDIFSNHRVQDEIKIFYPKERFLRLKATSIVSDNKMIGTVIVFQDITEIKRVEKMKTDFMTNVSHELKTPLTSIKGFAETLRYVDKDNDKNRFLDIIDEEIERLTRLINDILILSDIELKKRESKEVIDINKEINHVYNLMKDTCLKSGMNLKLNLGKDLYISGEKDDLRQMLINLVDNSVKYSEGKTIKITSKCENNEIILIVEDDGVGIPSEHAQRVFERFYRIDKDRSRRKGGTGLGLAIVKHIVYNLKGSIELKKGLLKGCRFIIKFNK